MSTLLQNPAVKLVDYQGEQLEPGQLIERITRLAFCITDQHGNFVEVNDAYTEFYGYSREELIGNHFTMVVPEAYRDYAADVHNRFIAGEVEMPAEWQVQRRNGELVRIYAEAIRVEGEGGNSKLTVIEPIR
jgi:PAS domain S-box-containing protein